MKIKFSSGLLLSVLLTLSVITLLSCTEKILNHRTDFQGVKMSLKLASADLADLIGAYRVTITAPDINPPIVIDTGLIEKDGYPYGTFAVPAGLQRTFTIEALAFQEISISEYVLYRGSTTMDIVPDSTTDLIIDMYPVPKCVKYTPRFIRVKSDSTFSLDLNVFNIKNLSSLVVSIPMFRDFLPFYTIDSALKGTSLGNNATFSAGFNGTNYEININRFSNQPLIVDETGKGNLTKIFFRAIANDFPPNTIHIPLIPVLINGDTVRSTDSLFIDGGTVEVGTGLPPGVVIDFPTDGQQFAERLTHVSGTVGNGLTSTATLSLNGHVQTIPVTGGLFDQSIVLFSGQNEIIVTAQGANAAIADTVHVTCTKPASALRVQLNWDKDSCDVDLWVTEPDGFKVYYDQKVSPNGGTLDIDNTQGFGPENYSIDNPPQGNYLVQVQLFDKRGVDSTTATIRIFEHEILMQTFQYNLTLNKQIWSVCNVSMPGGEIIPIIPQQAGPYFEIGPTSKR